MTKRIWELDALRGICIIGMIAVHFVYDLVSLYGLVQWEYGAAFRVLMDWGGVLFLLISGICVTLGSRCIRRGLIVFGCGMVITIATVGMHLLGSMDESVIIRFGVLHCLGLCMMAWHFLKKLPDPVLGMLGIAAAATGLLIRNVRIAFPGLFWLGLITPEFSSSDFFPLLPNLGFFLLGALAGRRIYRRKESLLPRANPANPLIRFLTFCGRQSLPIYLLHQPALTLLIMALAEW